MEVLQKITIYDLLGYTVPGTILVGVLEICFVFSKISLQEYGEYIGYICAGTILLGYAMGIAISELTGIIFPIISRLAGIDSNREIENIGCPIITKALINAKIIEKNGEKLTADDIKKYYNYMYACVQADTNCSRIHNYASSTLVCKNLSMVFFISTILLCNFGADIISKTGLSTCIFIAIGFSMSILFAKRWQKQKVHKDAYMLDWFVQKYSPIE